MTITSLFFRRIARPERPRKQRLAGAVRRIERDADARGRDEGGLIERKRLGERRDDPVCKHRRRIAVRDQSDHDELVATQTGDDLCVRYRMGQARGGFRQQPVARANAEPFIDAAHPVDVGDHHGDERRRSGHGIACPAQPLHDVLRVTERSGRRGSDDIGHVLRYRTDADDLARKVDEWGVVPLTHDRAAVAGPMALGDLHRAVPREHRSEQLRRGRAAARCEKIVVGVGMFHVIGVVAEYVSRRDVPGHRAKLQIPFDHGERSRVHVEDRPLLGRHPCVDPR